ncbi:hypothetical protein KIW84_030957 [Lathyrus oleraceus]|uniref:GAG-pre-integrase domain-containing protein n=1 Tax=Pisum sativum TaxID=3888 RepID=A0A9D4XPJ2_PEA|nr:hypothetical protein KIW84_030957 [Pisum sativum]
MGDDHFAPVEGKGNVVLEFSSGKTITLFNVLYVPKLRKNLISGPVLNKLGYKQVCESDKYVLSKSGVFVGFGYYNNGMFMMNLNGVPNDSGSVFMSSSNVINSSLWHARLGHATPSLGHKFFFVTFIDDASRFCYVYLLHAKDESLDKFKIYKTEVEVQQNVLIKTLRTDRGFWGEAMLRACYLLYRVHNKRNKTTPYELWYKKRPNLTFLRVWGCRAVVRLPDPKRKTLGEKGVACIFVGYAEHSKAYRFYVIEPNDSISINTIIESRDAIFDENCFSSIPRPKDSIPNSDESLRDDHSNDVPSARLKESPM